VVADIVKSKRLDGRDRLCLLGKEQFIFILYINLDQNIRRNNQTTNKIFAVIMFVLLTCVVVVDRCHRCDCENVVSLP
jgi:hypothetical protein